MLKRIFFIIVSVVLVLSLPTGCELIQPEGLAPIITEGTVLNLYGIDPHTLDPAISSDSTSHEYILQLFSGLVRLDANLEPAPDIASDWKVSKDGRTYTFYLRQDVIFHDGREVKAEDFKLSWERAANPDTGSQTAASYLSDIAGVKEVIAGKSEEISGVKIIDDYTLEVTIDAPKSYFLSKMTYPTAFVIDIDNVKAGPDWWHNPNGTGPFKLQEWIESSRLILERNDQYYGSSANIEHIVFHILSGVPMNLYEKGEIDVTGVSVYNIDRVTDTAGPFHDELHTNTELSFYYIGFDSTKPPFNDAKIRRAFSQAIDKKKLASLVFRDMMQSADGILPPGMPGFNEALSGLKYDVDEAKELIKKSYYGSIDNLPPLTITTIGQGGQISRELEAIIDQWRVNLGVEVAVRQLEPDRYFYHLKEEKDQMFDMGWIADYPHPQDFIEILFRSDTENNYGGYSNPKVDSLLERAGMEMDTDLSLKLYQQAEQKLVDDAACLPLWFGQNFVLVKPHVKGYDLNPMGLVNLNGVSVEK
ncbi:peptide ABC transporter substrate-binding protein [Chloroflexota bacterium]